MVDIDSTVWGVLMEITQSQLDKLDISEGVENGHYRQEKVIVITDDDVEHEFGSSHFGSGNEGPGCKEGQWPWPRLEE